MRRRCCVHRPATGCMPRRRHVHPLDPRCPPGPCRRPRLPAFGCHRAGLAGLRNRAGGVPELAPRGGAASGGRTARGAGVRHGPCAAGLPAGVQPRPAARAQRRALGGGPASPAGQCLGARPHRGAAGRAGGRHRARQVTLERTAAPAATRRAGAAGGACLRLPERRPAAVAGPRGRAAAGLVAAAAGLRHGAGDACLRPGRKRRLRGRDAGGTGRAAHQPAGRARAPRDGPCARDERQPRGRPAVDARACGRLGAGDHGGHALPLAPGAVTTWRWAGPTGRWPRTTGTSEATARARCPT